MEGLGHLLRGYDEVVEIKENLPGTIYAVSDATQRGSDVASDIAQSVADAASDAWNDLFE